MAWELDCPSALSAEVPDCPSAQVPQCLSALSTRVPEWLKCPSTRVPFECPPSAQVPSECPSAWVPSESPHSAQRNVKLALTWTLNKRLLLGDAFWANNHKVLANSMVSFTLYLYNFFQGREKHMKKLLCINNTPQQTFVLVKFVITEDVLKTSWSRLPCKMFLPWRRLQCNIFLSFKTSSRHNCTTSSWKRLEDVLKKASWRRFWKTSWKTKNCYADDVLENKKCLLGLWDFQTARFIGF